MGTRRKKTSFLKPLDAVLAWWRQFATSSAVLTKATVAIYLVGIALAILVLSWLSLPLPRPRRVFSWLRRPSVPRPRRNFGYPTEHDVIFNRDGFSEDDQN